MGREPLRIIQRSGISCAFVCEGYPCQSFSIHQRAATYKSTLVRGEQTASFVPFSSQIRAHKAFGCTTLQRRRSVQMTCSALWWFVVCFCLSRAGQIYNIAGSKSLRCLLTPPLKTPVTLPPPYIPLFFLILNKVNLMQPDKARGPRA